MRPKSRILVDVDGVVADLMGGFEFFIWKRHGLELRPREITTFHIAKSPAHHSLHCHCNLDAELMLYLGTPDCYDNVLMVDGAQEGIATLLANGHELAFVTATMKESPESYAPKFRWLDQRFPGVPVISCPSGQKHWFKADYGIDDRYDTCARWLASGITPLLFRQPWNEAPSGIPSYDWEGIIDATCR